MWCRCFGNPVKVVFFLVLIQLAATSVPFPQVWNVPAENHHFVGREDILAEISNLFKTASLKTAVVSGPQGFGKTQTAKRFVYQNFAHYDVVWWFRANQYLKPQFERFALAIAPYLNIDIQKSIHAIGHEHLISIIKEGIRRKNLKCLIIFDDAHTYADIEPYVLFSHEKTIHTLVTTKNANFASDTIQIKPFKREDSLKYINLFLSDNTESSKNQLAEHLSDCPVALAMAIDYIKNYPSMTIENYLSKHTKHKLSLPFLAMTSKKLGSSMDAYEKDLLVTIQINMKELRQRSREAFQFLSLLSILHRDEIPLNLMEKWVMAKGIKTNIMTLIGLINQYSLIEIADTKNKSEAYITMQDLIQEIVNSLVPLVDKKKLTGEAATLLKASFSDRGDNNLEAIRTEHESPLSKITSHLERRPGERQSLPLTRPITRNELL